MQFDRHQALGYREVLTRWVHQVLSDSTRSIQVLICQPSLRGPHRKEFLEDLITGSELARPQF